MRLRRTSLENRRAPVSSAGARSHLLLESLHPAILSTCPLPFRRSPGRIPIPKDPKPEVLNFPRPRVAFRLPLQVGVSAGLLGPKRATMPKANRSRPAEPTSSLHRRGLSRHADIRPTKTSRRPPTQVERSLSCVFAALQLFPCLNRMYCRNLSTWSLTAKRGDTDVPAARQEGSCGGPMEFLRRKRREPDISLAAPTRNMDGK